MGRKVRTIVSVLYSFVYLALIKLWHPFNFRYDGFIHRISPGATVFVDGVCQFGKRVRVHSGSQIDVSKGGVIKIGSDASFNNDCLVICHNRIEIGANSTFGPGVLIYDHDHDYKMGVENKKYKSSPVVIGKNCWIGANSIILRGTVLGDNCVVGAGAVIKGDFPDNSLIIQKRETVVREIVHVNPEK